MRFIALLSGGKDSIYNTMKALEENHQLVAVLNMKTPEEKDSYMYQYAGNNLVAAVAECLNVPLEQAETSGLSKTQDLDYQETADDEVEDLYHALKHLKEKYSLEGVGVGAIMSQYQNNRVINVCQRLSLTPLAYLWNRNQRELLEEMVDAKVDAILIKAGGHPLSALIGKNISEVLTTYTAYAANQIELSKGVLTEEDFNVCGEGGEYETLTLDAPIFTKRIVLTKTSFTTDETDTVTLNLLEFKVVLK
ncbi:diphthine-ammonia ligase [Nematocida displodere]|uniref:Diphthine--ammonia ligase n=1 Tax=Nematocida displodere TaxID=1805483 RepID=A0A177ECS8_9MICR|nr:diphthine-ammonia ligase [Nematocida displodere]